MSAVHGVHADRVWRVLVLQGHEEVRRTRPHEADVCRTTVHRGQCSAISPSASLLSFAFIALTLLVAKLRKSIRPVKN